VNCDGMINPPVGEGCCRWTSVVESVRGKEVGELWPFLWAQIGVLACSLSLPDQHAVRPYSDYR